ncbi:plasmid mobilization protein [Streptococcus oralis]|uniref:plasmid mobilization protein n=2 Tax=Streptococcus oralis TaxID=1303 RepID=UPI001EFE22C2|nr:plasmid mobilization relaxosome protein MobC [Streptococcus oralis]MCY7075312.1 plasmid mobilization relaxosome protein MobC [Streptococcus oralis]
MTFLKTAFGYPSAMLARRKGALGPQAKKSEERIIFLNNGEKRKRMIQKKIRLTEEEARFISTKVAESGMTNFNAFARIMLIMGEVKILNFEELKELRKEINRIGVNINQVAKKVNEDDQASLNELSQILELQKHLKDTVNQFIQKQENQTKEQERWL